MPTFDSPVARFPGYIELPEWWNIAQLRAFEQTLPVNRANGKIEQDTDKIVWRGYGIEQRPPALLHCGIQWHIQGVPEEPTLESFPVTPIGDAGDLIDCAYNLLIELWSGEIRVPK